MRPFLTFCNDMRPICQKLFYKLSDFERARSTLLQFYASSRVQRIENNNIHVTGTINLQSLQGYASNSFLQFYASKKLRQKMALRSLIFQSQIL